MLMILMMMKFVCIIIWLPLSADENVFYENIQEV